ncbi:hypothetical protein Glo7428_2213 [Gloeocapsa sp. PCC 7428]|uniref:DUF3084 domain-containing protein n=1 Tax=Gloeocapsa sp. PCC 7428 TaxID=1173026 RepID=UPI0002A5FE0A|nr:DUF3084 domain-containing protein [Gloeocapsa sp. PCC 7428]AFZ30734.1 hypothetical protein Glo7428_2213 [Gloeocapsa sp. PCC 7428]
MTTGYILIASILILGGVIATVGDRLGTRVGKARLSLFNLRPRNTAVVITILTGSIISASTLAILFAADERLRTGVFELEEIQSELRDRRQQLEATRQQLEATTQEKTQVQQELVQARAEQRAEQREAQRREAEAQQRLEAINESLQAARTQQAQTQAQLNRTQARQSQTQAQLNQTQQELTQVSAQFQQAQARLKTVSQRARELRAEIQQVQSELQQLVEQRDQLKAQITQRDREIAKLDESITQRDQVIAQRESRLKQLEVQQNYLEQEAQSLERNLQVLRRGNVALFRGQVLAGGVVRIVDPKAARQAVDQLLAEANRTALKFTQPGIEQVNAQVVNISPAQVDQLVAQIDDGRDYVVRIMSAGNYVLGERSVQVIADAAQNQVVFRPGDVLAAISANPATMSDNELRQRVELLLGASNFRAQRAGILGDTIQIGDNRIETLIGFIEQLKQYNQPVEIQAVAAEVTYTAGPLKVELLATQNGQVVFRT